MRLLAFITLLSLAAHAQTATGTISVVAEDSSQAVVPRATISVTNKATGLTRAGSTGDRGEFQATFLPAGEYSVTVQANGFKRSNLAAFTLQVDQNATVRVTLTPGEVVETIQVTESTPLLEADTSSLGQVIENKKILELPLNGRNPFALGLLAGNTTPVAGMGTNLPFIAGGGRFSANEVLLDGVDNNTTVTSGAIGRSGIAMQPSVDAVQEFKVKTNSFSAEFGHAAGAVISATIKSGSNDYHGTLFEFLRNDKLDAKTSLAASSEAASSATGRSSSETTKAPANAPPPPPASAASPRMPSAPATSPPSAFPSSIPSPAASAPPATSSAPPSPGPSSPTPASIPPPPPS